MPSLPIQFINLTKDVERRERMVSQLQHSGLQATRLPAVWWKDLPPAEQQRYFRSPHAHGRYFKPLSDGEKGCYCSHLMACEALLQSDAPAMVVLEDDVRLLPDFSRAIEAIGALPAPGAWDMIKLYGRENEKIADQAPLIVGALQLISYRRIPSFAAGYVISRCGAQKMLSTRIPFDRPVDVDIRFWFENDLKVLGVYPSVIALDDTSQVSSIWAEPEARAGIGQRLRKFQMKLQLYWGNRRATQVKASQAL